MLNDGFGLLSILVDVAKLSTRTKKGVRGSVRMIDNRPMGEHEQLQELSLTLEGSVDHLVERATC